MLTLEAAPAVAVAPAATAVAVVREMPSVARTKAMAQFRSVAAPGDSDEFLAGLASLGDARAFDLLVQ